MRGKWTFLFSTLSVASAAGAAYGFNISHNLSEQAELQEQLSVDTGKQFVETFSGDYVDQELGQLDRRRALLYQASHWHQVMFFSLVSLVLFGFATYTARVIETSFHEESAHAAVEAAAAISSVGRSS